MGPIKHGQTVLTELCVRAARALSPLRARLAPLFQTAHGVLQKLWHGLGQVFAQRQVQLVLYLLSLALLLSSFVGYGSVWLEFNQRMLTDPDLQSDDARTAIFPFHRYADDPALQDDPIADEMLSLVPTGIWVMYRILVPITDVFIAPKIVQGMAFGLVLVAGGVLGRARRAGWGAGVLLVFFVVHDWFAVERIAGGLGRAFGFPCFALWLAGVLAGKRWARFGAAVIAALTYPSVMLLLLAAEGLYAVRDLRKLRYTIVLGRLRRYGMLLVVCLVAVLPSLSGSAGRGPVHSLEQAQSEPAFGRSGRLWILPFAEPSKVFLETYLDPLLPRGESPLPAIQESYKGHAESWAATFLALLVAASLLGFAPRPGAAIAFTCGAVILYLLSRLLAFQLYSPERYYSFGMRMAALALLVGVPARMFAGLRKRPRAISRNLLSAGLLLLVWVCAGHGQKAPSGMFVNANHDRPLYEFVRTLPKNARLASHPLDGDGIPYFGARATMGTFETLQPWFVDSWRRQKLRCNATLRALYATERRELLDYTAEYQVTHLLLNRQRYRSNFAAKSASFQPFTAYARALLSRHQLQDLVLADVPDSAVVYSYKHWQVVDMERLRAAWRR